MDFNEAFDNLSRIKLDNIELSEATIQARSVRWYNNEYCKNHIERRGLFFSVHNNAIDEVKGAIAVGLGRQEGASDTIYLSRFGVLLIEFKDSKGVQSKAQSQWQDKMKVAGYIYVIVRSEEEARFVITKWDEAKGQLVKNLNEKDLDRFIFLATQNGKPKQKGRTKKR